MMNVNITKLKPTAIIPKYSRQGDACLDICSTDTTVIKPGETKKVFTGLAVELPEGYRLCVYSRSGLAAKNSINVLNAPGIIDSNYRGEIIVILHNHSDKKFQIHAGDRIAQVAIEKVEEITFNEVDAISTDTNRGSEGFGSSGIN